MSATTCSWSTVLSARTGRSSSPPTPPPLSSLRQLQLPTWWRSSLSTSGLVDTRPPPSVKTGEQYILSLLTIIVSLHCTIDRGIIVLLYHCIIDIIILLLFSNPYSHYSYARGGGSGRILFTFLLANNVCQVKQFVCRKSKNYIKANLSGTTQAESTGVL